MAGVKTATRGGKKMNTQILAGGKVEVPIIDTEMAIERVNITLGSINSDKPCIFSENCTFLYLLHSYNQHPSEEEKLRQRD
jgi:hypothetical protein